MSLGGYADEVDDVGKLSLRGRFWAWFGAGFLVTLCGWSTLSGLVPGARLVKSL